jgi:hypothetical protein
MTTPIFPKGLNLTIPNPYAMVEMIKDPALNPVR